MSMVFARRPFALLLLVALLGLALVAPAPEQASAGGHRSDGSGGKAVPHHAGGARVESRSATRNAPSARLHEIGHEAAEPTLGLTRKGNIFVSAFQTNTRIEVVRSKNEGKSWDVVSPKLPNGRNAQLLSFDPYVYVDQWTSRVFTIDLTVACSYLSFSDDEGESWVTNPLACGRPVNDHQTLFSGPPTVSTPVGYDNVVYYCWNDIATSSCSKSLDGGISFSPTGSPAFLGTSPAEEGPPAGVETCGGLHGHGHVGPDGTLYLPRGYCGQPWLAISKDEGATWARVQVAKTGISHHEASVAADKKGNVYYTWVGEDRLPYLAISRNGGKKWSKPMMIGAPGVKEANLPSLDVGGAGKVAIAYMGSENSPFEPGDEPQRECTALTSCPDPEGYEKVTWNAYTTISADVLDQRPLFYSATVNDKGDPLVRGTCGPGRCKAVYDFIDIVVAHDGTAWSSWVDACTSVCAEGGTNIGAAGVVGQLVGGPSLK